MTEEDDRRLNNAIESLDLHMGDISTVLRTIEDAGFVIVPKQEAPGPLEALGLGPMWRPTPTSWRWAKIAIAGDLLSVLRLSNGGGVLGGAFRPEQLEQFIGDAEEQGGVAPTQRIAVPEPSKLHIPGR